MRLFPNFGGGTGREILIAPQVFQESLSGGSQMGAQGHSLQFAHNRLQLCPFGALFKGNFRHKMTSIVGNRGQLWTSTLSPHLLSPHLDSPDHFFVPRPSKGKKQLARLLIKHGLPVQAKTREGCGCCGFFWRLRWKAPGKLRSKYQDNCPELQHASNPTQTSGTKKRGFYKNVPWGSYGLRN